MHGNLLLAAYQANMRGVLLFCEVNHKNYVELSNGYGMIANIIINFMVIYLNSMPAREK